MGRPVPRYRLYYTRRRHLSSGCTLPVDALRYRERM